MWRGRTAALFDTVFSSARTSGTPLTDASDRIEVSSAGLVLSYSQATAEWLTNVAERPGDRALIRDHLRATLVEASSPLGRVTVEFVALFASQFGPPLSGREAAAEALGEAVAMLKEGAARLLAIALEVLPVLRAPAAAPTASETIDDTLFELCDGPLRAVLHVALEVEDAHLVSQLRAMRLLLPRHLGQATSLSRRFWLDAPHGSDEPPYASSISIARAIPRISSPDGKLRCFAEACTEVARCVERASGVETAPGADELIPLMAYVLIRARVPHIASDLALVEACIPADQLLGSHGYCLATLHAAVHLISSLRWACPLLSPIITHPVRRLPWPHVPVHAPSRGCPTLSQPPPFPRAAGRNLTRPARSDLARAEVARSRAARAQATRAQAAGQGSACS